MYPLILFSIYGVAIILYKCLQLLRISAFSHAPVDEAAELLKSGKTKEALALLDQFPCPASRVMGVAIEQCSAKNHPKTCVDAEINRFGLTEIRNMESHLKGLELVANATPLLGLLGTVIGLVSAFAAIQNAGTSVNPAMLAGGIWEALITTVTGLVIAIPAMVALYVFDSALDKNRSRMEEAVQAVFGSNIIASS